MWSYISGHSTQHSAGSDHVKDFLSKDALAFSREEIRRRREDGANASCLRVTQSDPKLPNPILDQNVPKLTSYFLSIKRS